MFFNAIDDSSNDDSNSFNNQSSDNSGINFPNIDILSNNKLQISNDNSSINFLNIDIEKNNELQIILEKGKEPQLLLSEKLKEKQVKKKPKLERNNWVTVCKGILLKNMYIFINKKIRKIYKDIGNGLGKKQFLSLNTKLKSNKEVTFNKNLLKKTIGEILSEISNRYTDVLKDYNKNLLQRLLNEEDMYKRNLFQNLFNLTFFQCLEHFRGTREYEELRGMNVLENEINNSNDKAYNEQLEIYFHRYEILINNKKPRKNY